MTINTLSFYSVRKRGVTMDIQLIKDYLEQTDEDIAFRFFTKNEINENPKITQMIRLSKKEFSKTTGHALCIDESMPKDLPGKEPGVCRLYLAQPFDFLFKNYLSKESKQHNKMTFSACTHIFTGVPLVNKLVCKNYNTDHLTVIEDVCLPKTWDILHGQKRDQIRKYMEYYFPQMKNKKIVSVLLTGTKRNEEGELIFPGESLKKLADLMDDDVFILYNALDIARSLEEVSGDYKDRLGFTGCYLTDSQIVYITDLLITNTANHAVDFAGTGKPVYCYSLKDNGFTTYMRENYPGLCLESLEELGDKDLFHYDQDPDYIHFYRDTTSLSGRNPFEVIGSLFSSGGKKEF